MTGGGEGILGRHRRAISAYTWCVMEKGPQRKWLQNRKRRHSRMPLPEPDRAVGEAHGGRMYEVDRAEDEGAEGLEDKTYKKQKEGERGRGGGKRKRERGGGESREVGESLW